MDHGALGHCLVLEPRLALGHRTRLHHGRVLASLLALDHRAWLYHGRIAAAIAHRGMAAHHGAIGCLDGSCSCFDGAILSEFAGECLGKGA